MIKNIIFDVGKVLVEWDCDSAFHKLGFEGEILSAVAEATVRSTEWDEYDRSMRSDEEQLACFVGNAPRYEREIRLFWENVGLPIYQYAYSIPWIRSLKAAGYRVYILSNYARHTYDCTSEALSFLSEVDGAVFSFEVHSVKPEPEIYKTLLEKYGLIPQECIFLDDRKENLTAAETFGIHTIWFTSYEEACDGLRKQGVEF